MPLLLFLTLFAGVFFGGSYAQASDPDVRIRPGMAFASPDGRPVVLVPYERHGVRGMFQLLTQDMFQTRLAAVDPASGSVLWDTQLSDELIWDVSVLATGSEYAYLATDSGLVVVGLADGTVVAEGAGVRGLGEKYLAAASAYGYDPAARRVLALNAAGEVLTIGVDRLAAVRADAQTAAAWSARLSLDGTTTTPQATSQEATAGGERFALRDLPFGTPGTMLVRLGADGRESPVGGLAFVGGELVVDGTTAVGGPGLVMVEHHRSANDGGAALSLVPVATGQPTATVDLAAQVERALPGPDGLVAIAARSDFVVARGDELIHVTVGESGLFG